MATIAAIVGAGASIYQGIQSSQAASNANVGSVPKAAEYEPVDYTEEQLKTVMGNLSNFGPIRGLVNKTNAFMTRDDIRRAQRLIPGYSQMMSLQGNSATSLLNGELPFDDVLSIVRNRGASTGAVGIPGTGGPATLRDLGLSRLDAMKTGAGMMKGMVDIAETISPINRYSRMQDYFLTPSQTIPWEIEQRQLEQQSQQNANNLAASASPSSIAQQAGAISGGPDYAGAIGQIASLLPQRSSSSGTSGQYMDSFYSNPVPGTINQIYRPNWASTAPVIV